MLKLEDVRFAYEARSAPWRFDLSIAPGEIVAVTGPSGSGKSTLLDLIAGFLTPEGGRMTLDGSEFGKLAPESRPVSILFQADNLFEHLSALANVELGLARDVPAPERRGRARKALAEMGLADSEKRRAARLSGGEKQRVALARTLLRDRPVLLLDEPFTALDAETAEAMREIVASLVRARGWHAIVVSHLPEDYSGFADRRLAITDNRLSAA